MLKLGLVSQLMQLQFFAIQISVAVCSPDAFQVSGLSTDSPSRLQFNDGAHSYSSQDQNKHLNTGNVKRFDRELEKGQIMITDDKTSPYIPPGWPHMEYTLVDGFQIVPSLDFRTPVS